VKVVLDSNILISAFSSQGLCNLLFESSLEYCEIILSDFILKEVRKFFNKKTKLPKNQIDEIENYLKEFCTINKYKNIKANICRDKSDDEIIFLAISSNVEYIITGDKDLLILKKYKSVIIKSPREFWEILKVKTK